MHSHLLLWTSEKSACRQEQLIFASIISQLLCSTMKKTHMRKRLFTELFDVAIYVFSKLAHSDEHLPLELSVAVAFRKGNSGSM